MKPSMPPSWPWVTTPPATSVFFGRPQINVRVTDGIGCLAIVPGSEKRLVRVGETIIGIGHAQGLQKCTVNIFIVGLASDFFDEITRDAVTGIRVGHARVRRPARILRLLKAFEDFEQRVI